MAPALFAWQIVLSPDALPAEKTAAEELKAYFLQICPSAPFDGQKPYIHIGATPEAGERFGIRDWNDPGEVQNDEVFYRVTEDGDLWLAGDPPRGTLYAVYELLEREYGVKFFTEDCQVVPRQDKIELPAIGRVLRYRPGFAVRIAGYSHLLNGTDRFAAQMRNNGVWRPSSAEWGGKESIIGFVHTFERWLPPSKYFAEHPEWYSLRFGKRQQGKFSQLCMTNQEMRAELTKVVIEQLRANPTAQFISVSQNDNLFPCNCDNCQEFIRENGNQTDLLIDLVNEVAEAAEKEFDWDTRRVFIETLAYQFTRHAPKKIRPRHNVSIRYCTIEQAQSAPLTDPRNKAILDDLNDWRMMVVTMMIWNYVTDFHAYYQPHPNWTAMAPDLRLFRDCHTINLFEQGAYNQTGPAADLPELRTYLLSRLMWNPDLDEEQLIQEFAAAFYGPAAPAVLDYIADVTAEAGKHPEYNADCFVGNTAGWLSDEGCENIWRKLFAAVKEFGEEPVIGTRIANAALPITMTLLERTEHVKNLSDVQPLELLDWVEKTLAPLNLKALDEHSRISPEAWLTRIRDSYNLNP